MSLENSTLDGFVADATAILRQTETNLTRLAQAALAQSGNAPATATDPAGAQTSARLQQIGQQLAKLSQSSNYLQTTLQNGLQPLPIDDNVWPRTRILQSQEEERTQVARELEDTVGQLLANAVFELASCRHLLTNDQEAVSNGLDALQRELEQGLADIRQFIVDLDPAAILNNFGLGGGIRRYLEQFQARFNINTQLRINTNFGRLPNMVEVAIFRIIQEALQNVWHHAHATQVEVIFAENEAGLEFSVIDNGRGMASDRVDVSRKNFGLVRMVDYADLIHGKLRIFSEPEQGTHVILSIPFDII